MRGAAAPAFFATENHDAMNIRYIQLGGEKVPVYFGHRALKLICDELKVSLDELLNGKCLESFDNQLKVAHVGIREGYRMAVKAGEYGAYEQAPDMLSRILADMDELLDVLDQQPEALEEIFAVYAEHVLEWAKKKLAAQGNLQAKVAQMAGQVSGSPSQESRE